MLASSRGTYCTAGYLASFSVSALVVSAITTLPAVTRTRRGLGVMVIGWSGPGSFMSSRLFGRSASRGTLSCLYPHRMGNIVAGSVTWKAVHAKVGLPVPGTPAVIRRLKFRSQQKELDRNANGRPRYRGDDQGSDPRCRSDDP